MNAPVWGSITLVLWIVMALGAAWHTLLNKKLPQSKLLWLMVIAAVPLLGAGLYAAVGVDRIGRRATIKQLQNREVRSAIEGLLPVDAGGPSEPAERWGLPTHLVDFAHLLSNVSRYRAVRGNTVELIDGGDRFFPRLLGAIDSATRFVVLETYIFDCDAIGTQLLQALRRATQRGVACHVLYDSIGSLHLDLVAVAEAQAAGVHISPFASRSLLRGRFQINLRNHRKILVVDGVVGFTGGMNISARHVTRKDVGILSEDIHFEVKGPVVHQLTAAFAEDWHYATGARLIEPDWYPEVQHTGAVTCRTLPSGPDGDAGVWHKTLVTAIHNATSVVRLMNPYFIPDPAVMMALTTAAQRGVRVEIVVPRRTDHRYVDWAMKSFFGELLEAGVKVFRRPAPFVHAKLLVIDDIWATIGSANLDPRSFVLNYELNLGISGGTIVRDIVAAFEGQRDRSEPLLVKWWEDRHVVLKAWANFWALWSPLL